MLKEIKEHIGNIELLKLSKTDFFTALNSYFGGIEML
jgi:hypothetical protein